MSTFLGEGKQVFFSQRSSFVVYRWGEGCSIYLVVVSSVTLPEKSEPFSKFGDSELENPIIFRGKLLLLVSGRFFAVIVSKVWVAKKAVEFAKEMSYFQIFCWF